MFKFILALALAFGVASVAYGSAAWLDVNGGTVQAGDDYDLKCDDNGVKVLWDKYVEAAEVIGADKFTFMIDRVQIKDISTHCAGAIIEVALTCKDETGTNELCRDVYGNLIPVIHEVVDNDGEQTIDIPNIPAKWITDIHIAIVTEMNPPGCEGADQTNDCPQGDQAG